MCYNYLINLLFGRSAKESNQYFSFRSRMLFFFYCGLCTIIMGLCTCDAFWHMCNGSELSQAPGKSFEEFSSAVLSLSDKLPYIDYSHLQVRVPARWKINQPNSADFISYMLLAYAAELASAKSEITHHTDDLWLEFGVGGGYSLNLTSIIRSKSTNDPIYGFDTFTGIPTDWIGTSFKKGHLTQNGKVPALESNTEIVRGPFEETLRSFIGEHIQAHERSSKRVSFVHIDSDMYSGTRFVLEALWPALREGAFVYINKAFVKNVDKQGPLLAGGDELRAFYDLMKTRRGKHHFVMLPVRNQYNPGALIVMKTDKLYAVNCSHQTLPQLWTQLKPVLPQHQQQQQQRVPKVGEPALTSSITISTEKISKKKSDKNANKSKQKGADKNKNQKQNEDGKSRPAAFTNVAQSFREHNNLFMCSGSQLVQAETKSFQYFTNSLLACFNYDLPALNHSHLKVKVPQNWEINMPNSANFISNMLLAYSAELALGTIELRQQAKLEDLWLEFGVGEGYSLNLTALIRATSSQTPVHGFDSFLGLPQDWKGTPFKKGRFSRNGVAPLLEKNTVVVKGLFEKTIKHFVKNQKSKEVALINIDCELSQNAFSVLSSLIPLMRGGTIIHFSKAFRDVDEHLTTVGGTLEALYALLKKQSSTPYVLLPVRNQYNRGALAVMKVDDLESIDCSKRALPSLWFTPAKA